MLRRLIKFSLAGSALLLALSLWFGTALPPPAVLDPVLLEEPLQQPVERAPVEVTKGGVRYAVKPLYEYELVGLVVSTHDSDAWWDFIHRESNDHLNIADLCVVWGSNARSGAYADIRFSSGQFTCNFSTNSSEAFAAFDQFAISNNHLLTTDSRLAKRVRSVRVGDQIRFRGYLVEYSHNHGFAFRRGTSTTRRDTGNGACETVYLESFEIIREGGRPWRLLAWLAGIALVASLIGWFVQPARFDD